MMAGKYPFKLRFNKKAIREWAGRYPRDYDWKEGVVRVEKEIAERVKALYGL